MFYSLQRNHTLFGSVWSSMRRKGQAPFSKRGLGSSANKTGINGSNKIDRKHAHNTDGEGDFLYNSMRQVVSDGMNHITKTLMQGQRVDGGIDDVAGMMGSENDEYNFPNMGNIAGNNDMPSHRQENIPMRPLMINNNNNNNNNPNNNMIGSNNMNQHNLANK